ncbi:MAG: hypothetical protein JW881_16500 [Spirochaetales bacterium]|nr:hypothetical protein [Spirochaetales bacterium]
MFRVTRTTIVFVILFAVSQAACAETFFIYSHEVYNGESIPFEFRVKEGVMEGLFDAGHIVFDDVSESEEDLLAEGMMDGLFQTALRGGARYLVGIHVRTETAAGEGEAPGISVQARYFLFDLRTAGLMDSGDLSIDSSGREDAAGKEMLWMECGRAVSEKIHDYFLRNIRKISRSEWNNQQPD